MRLRAPRSGAATAFAQAGAQSRSTPWREARWCALDLELTGLDSRNDDIIAIGAVPIDSGRIMLGEAMYTLVRSTKRSERAAVLVHKLRLPDVADAPPLEDAIDLVLSALTGRVPVFHTAAVERSFLRPLFAGRRVRLPAAADTEALGRLWLTERDGEAPAGLSLATLLAQLQLPAEPAHHALGDALMTAKAFIALASHLEQRDPQSVGSLVGAGARAVGMRRFGPG